MLCSAMKAADFSGNHELNRDLSVTAPLQAENIDTIAIQLESLYLRYGSIVDAAKKYLGKRYLSGHQGPNAFDCSGLTS